MLEPSGKSAPAIVHPQSLSQPPVAAVEGVYSLRPCVHGRTSASQAAVHRFLVRAYSATWMAATSRPSAAASTRQQTVSASPSSWNSAMSAFASSSR